MNTVAVATGFLVGLVLTLGLVVMLCRYWLLPMRPLAVRILHGKSFVALQGQTLLRALQDAGIEVPAACGGTGSCGQCRVRVLDGGGEFLPIERARLSTPALARGERLACQLVLRQGIKVELDAALLGAERWPCVVSRTTALAPLMREVVVEMPPEHSLAFRPGSYVMVHAPPFRVPFAQIEPPDDFRDAWMRLQSENWVASSDSPVSRAYSIANVPADGTRHVVLLVRLALPPPDAPDAPPGKLSSWLFSRRPGDPVQVSGPFGDFGAQDSQREMIFIGGGVGMAPLRAMIAHQLQVKRSTRTISFWYGARSRIDLFHREEFDELARAFSNFRWTVALSDPGADDAWEGERGFVHEVLHQCYLRHHPNPQDCEFYLCGPPLMIKAVLALLADLGVPPERIFNDDFGSAR